MKKIYSSIVSIGAAILLVSCSNVLESGVELQQSNAPVINATQEAPSRSSITVDGEGVGTIYWSPSDEISVFYGASTPVLYTSTNTAPETTAAFTTTAIIGSTELASTNIWGLYPHNPSAVCNGSSITTTLPAVQYGVSGTFDDDLFLTVAHSDDTNLRFFNVCGGIKFSLSRDDITSITFSGNNNEDIAGDITVSFVEGLPSVSVVNGVKTITLTPKDGGTFAANTDYYLIAIPQSLSNGFTMTFETGSQIGTFNYTAKAVTLKRSVFSKKNEIDSFATFSTSYSHRQILYTSTDGNVVNPYDPAVFGSNIISNSYENGEGVILFDSAVQGIGDYAFSGCTSLSSMTIPDSVTSIGNYAFSGCTSLSSITIPGSITSIGVAAFKECTNLSSVSILYGVTSIGNAAFRGCTNLSSITIPDSVTSIGYYAFNECSSLTSITIPDSVTSIGESAFERCTSLTSVTIPCRMTSIGKYAFKGCANLSSIAILNGLTSIGEFAFADCTGLSSIMIPDSVTSIGESAFERCTSLTSVTIPCRMTSIGKYAFKGCTNLSSIAILNGLTSIGEFAFADCTGLSSIMIPNSVTSIGNYAFSGCTSLTSITIPDSVTSIGRGAFYKSSLTSVTIPDSVTNIEQSAFSNCASLTSVTLPDSVTNIGEDAFGYCASLTSITIPDSVTNMGRGAFFRCSSLTSVTIPDKVTSIGEYAFMYCSAIRSITIMPGTPPSGGQGMFNQIEQLAIFVPAESVDSYKTARYWSNYADRIYRIP